MEGQRRLVEEWLAAHPLARPFEGCLESHGRSNGALHRASQDDCLRVGESVGMGGWLGGDEFMRMGDWLDGSEGVVLVVVYQVCHLLKPLCGSLYLIVVVWKKKESGDRLKMARD